MPSKAPCKYLRPVDSGQITEINRGALQTLLNHVGLACGRQVAKAASQPVSLCFRLSNAQETTMRKL